MTAKIGIGREWDYHLVVETMESAALHLIRVYIMMRQATIAERVACHHIYALCTEA